jgi:tetratricopeptide (TPR) repeat protein
MKDNYRFVLFLPFLIFGAGVWLYFQTENEVRAQMAQAQARWRVGAYEDAITLYESVSRNYPASRYADDALWEVATIYYFNYYDVNRALSCFQRLATVYPGTPLAKESHLKLAEINEIVLKDLGAAIAHLNEALSQDPSIRSRRLICFKLGSDYLKLDRFDEARRQFTGVIRDGPDDHLADQASIRIGSILQIGKKYDESVPFFLRVLDRTKCRDCRGRAKLGLIESYEFMDDLPKAIAVAKSIDTGEYPEQLKLGLLKRLTDKNRYDGQKLWGGQ